MEKHNLYTVLRQTHQRNLDNASEYLNKICQAIISGDLAVDYYDPPRHVLDVSYQDSKYYAEDEWDMVDLSERNKEYIIAITYLRRLLCTLNCNTLRTVVKDDNENDNVALSLINKAVIADGDELVDNIIEPVTI